MKWDNSRNFQEVNMRARHFVLFTAAIVCAVGVSATAADVADLLRDIQAVGR